MQQISASDAHIAESGLKGIEILAKVLGVAVPPANLLATLIETVRDRKTERQIRKLEELVDEVIPRLERLEESISKPEDPDLLDEILAKAVNDEHEAKTHYYAALIEYAVSGTREAYQVRLLADAIKGLTPLEIRAFEHFDKHGALRKDIPEDLRDIFWDRICTFGLYPRAENGRQGCTTALGVRLLEVCRLAEAASKNR